MCGWLIVEEQELSMGNILLVTEEAELVVKSMT